MSEAKKQVSYRLTADTLNELQSIAKRNGVSPAQVIALLVHAYASGVTESDELEKWFDVARRG